MTAPVKSIHGDQSDLAGMVGEQVLQQPFEMVDFPAPGAPAIPSRTSTPLKQRFCLGEELLLA